MTVRFVTTHGQQRALADRGGAVRADVGRLPPRGERTGSRPKPLHPDAVRVLRDRGIDASGRRSKHLGEFAERGFSHVVTLCDRVREVCPEFPGAPEQIHWSIPDPAREPGDDEQTLPAFERTAAELEMRLGFFIAAINDTRQEVTRDA